MVARLGLLIGLAALCAVAFGTIRGQVLPLNLEAAGRFGSLCMCVFIDSSRWFAWLVCDLLDFCDI